MIKERVREVFVKLFEDDIGSLAIKPNIKPTHGSCCTCQECGYHHDDCNCRVREINKGIDQAVTEIIQLLRSSVPAIEPEQLHNWYLEAITDLDGKDYNHKADRPYEKLTEGQKSIDKYIADKINCELMKLLKGDV